MTDGSPFYILLYLACMALMAVCDAWLVWQRRKARAGREHPTTYLSPEECARGEGQRITRDPRFVVVAEPEPLPPGEQAAIDRALDARVRKRGTR